MKSYWVYMMSNSNRKVLYVGVTNNIKRRVLEHRSRVNPSFTKRYNCFYLVYYEEWNDINAAIRREKEIKKWRREKKDRLIHEMNPTKADLSAGWS